MAVNRLTNFRALTRFIPFELVFLSGTHVAQWMATAMRRISERSKEHSDPI
jgi:hypothetical protein